MRINLRIKYAADEKAKEIVALQATSWLLKKNTAVQWLSFKVSLDLPT